MAHLLELISGIGNPNLIFVGPDESERHEGRGEAGCGGRGTIPRGSMNPTKIRSFLDRSVPQVATTATSGRTSSASLA